MKKGDIIELRPRKWRELALYYGKMDVMRDAMTNEFGLKRVPAVPRIEYEIIDVHKYLIFMMRWP